jgi:ABC-type antimicrobial peptide transport system permease subunit
VALGARRTNIVSLVLKDGFRPIAEGLFIGLATATVFRFYLRTAMAAVDVAPLDAGACVAAAVLVGVAGATACYLPARRASSVDPNVALRRS